MSASTHQYSDDTGFIRVDDDNILNGVIDINTVEKLIVGTKEALSYFMRKEDSSLNSSKDINFPVQTREGCWEILIPVFTYAAGTATGALTKGLNAYTTKYGTLKAEQQFAEKDIKQVYRESFNNLQAVIKIAQHLNTVSNKKALVLKQVDMRKRTALLINDKANVMSVTLDEIEAFTSCPDKILRSIASVVTDRRTVSIGYHFEGKTREEVIDIDSKDVFAPSEEKSESILPSLLDGQNVKLVGHVRRGNQRTNTLGFEYDGHIITCEPNKRLITGFLDQHYKKCEISGVVRRTSKIDIAEGRTDRPRIIFDDLVIIQTTPQMEQSKLVLS